MPSQPHPRVSPAITFWHLAGTALAWLATWFLAQVALGTRTGQWLDEQALRAANDMWGTGTSRVGGWLLQALDLLPTLALIVGAIAVVVFTLRSRRALPAVVGIAGFAASLITVQVLKRWVLDKPNFAIHEAIINSFPSGHSALAAAAGMVVVLAAPARYRSWTALIAALASIVAGASTVINAWHRPSDVIAAVLVTAGWGLLGGLVLCATTGRAEQRPGLWVAMVMVVTGLALVLVAGFVSWLAFGGAGTGSALVAGMLALAAGALVSWGLVALILRHR